MLLRGYTIVHQATRVLRITGRPEESTGPSLAQDILEKSTAGFLKRRAVVVDGTQLEPIKRDLNTQTVARSLGRSWAIVS